jgi:hypothetical protein
MGSWASMLLQNRVVKAIKETGFSYLYSFSTPAAGSPGWTKGMNKLSGWKISRGLQYLPSTHWGLDHQCLLFRECGPGKLL